MVDPAQLLVAIQAGDRAAFDCLVRTQTKRLYALAYRVTGDSDLADDVVQETFLRILERRSPFRQEGPAEAWLARVTTRLAIDQMRRRAARRSREEKHAMARERDKDQSGENLLAEAQASLLSDALASLSVETRAALWLHLVEGSGVREVAVCLGSTRSTVNRRIQSGLRELRDFLGRFGSEP